MVILIVDLPPQEERPHAQEGVHPLAFDEVEGVAVVGLGHDVAGDEHHAQPQEHQGEGAGQQDQVGVDPRGRWWR